MKRLVVIAVSVLAVGVAACSDDSDNGLDAGLSTSGTMTVNTSPVVVHVYRNPADTIPESDTVNFVPLPYYVPSDAVDRTPVITDQNGTVVPNGNNNVTASFATDRADLDDDGAIEGDTLGVDTLTYVFTDFNQNHATQTASIPITVVLGPPPAPRVILSSVHSLQAGRRIRGIRVIR